MKIGREEAYKKFSEDESIIINLIAASLQGDGSITKSKEEYLLSFDKKQIRVIHGLDDEALIGALDQLRKRSFELLDRSSLTLNGLIMRAKIMKEEERLEILIGAELAHHLVMLSRGEVVNQS